MKIWIDLDNSPSALLFAPIVRRLEDRGDTVRVTARDNAQTKELALARWPDTYVVGGPSPPKRHQKVRALARRIRALRAWAQRERPDVALCHNAYAQIVAARSLRIPVVTAMDYEHQPANHLGFRLANIVLLPEALRHVGVERLGAHPGKTRFYPGLKEEIYLGDFEPDPDILAKVGVQRSPDRALVVARTPPDQAWYHQFGNPLFLDTLRVIGREAATCVLLPRYAAQRQLPAQLGIDNCVVPDSAVDSRSLMREADVVIGAGGTMTREAALLGARTYSVYAGRSPAVDLYLEREGRLTRLERPDGVLPLEVTRPAPIDLDELRARGEVLIDHFVEAVDDAVSARR